MQILLCLTLIQGCHMNTAAAPAAPASYNKTHHVNIPLAFLSEPLHAGRQLVGGHFQCA